jgi:predicted dithiol-disulfide oxidoreductase (DUF899 family)
MTKEEFTMTDTLEPAAALAARNPVRILNESAAYRAARQELLIQEYELRRLTEKVAAMRRALPEGAAVTGNYRFIAEDGREVGLAEMLADKTSLAVYNFMFGPKRARPCPMCTNLLGALEGNANDIQQKMALAVVARSPIERLIAFKKERGWRFLKLYSDANGEWSRDFHAVGDDGGDIPGLHVFTRRDGSIRHFWSGEMTEADPGQDPRGAPELAPLWHMLDTTPEGRDPSWYPELDYPG